jgi:hypothetical protein
VNSSFITSHVPMLPSGVVFRDWLCVDLGDVLSCRVRPLLLVLSRIREDIHSMVHFVLGTPDCKGMDLTRSFSFQSIFCSYFSCH